MSDLNTLKEIVEQILEERAETRDSDDLLYLAIIRNAGMSGVSVDHFFLNRKYSGIPPFESVRRARQKAQADHPELKGTRTAERKEAEDVYCNFARS